MGTGRQGTQRRTPVYIGVLLGLAVALLAALVGVGGAGATGRAPRGAPVSAPVRAAATGYTITDLGDLGSGDSQAYGINASGQVVGTSSDAGGNQSAFIYSGGVMTSVNAQLPSGTGWATRQGYAINDSGAIVGLGYPTVSPYHFHGYKYQNGTYTDIGALTSDASSYSTASAINASGTVIGLSHFSDTGVNANHSVRYANGSLTDLDPSSGHASDVYGINDAGIIVGYIGLLPFPHCGAHAARYQDGAFTDLGTLLGSDCVYGSEAYAINAGGTIVGTSAMAAGHYHAFVYANGTMTDLTPDSTHDLAAYAINTTGQIVGGDFTGSGGVPFLWQNGALTDLSALLPANSGWTLDTARGINDSGQIVGSGTINGHEHAYLLDPGQSCALAAPAAVTAQALHTVTGRVVWGPNANLAGQGVGGATVRVGCATTTTDGQGTYTLKVDTGPQTLTATLPIFDHAATGSGADVVATRNITVGATDTTLPTLDGFGATLDVRVLGQDLTALGATITADTYTFPLDVALLPAPNDTPLHVVATYTRSSGVFALHTSGGTYAWGSQRIAVAHFDYASPANTFSFAGSADLTIGGLAISNAQVGGTRAPDGTISLLATGVAAFDGARFTFTKIALAGSDFTLQGNLKLANQTNPITVSFVVHDGASTFDLAVNDFAFNGAKLTVTLHYTSAPQPRLTFAGGGTARVGGSALAVTVAGTIAASDQLVRGQATLAFKEGQARVALAYDSASGVLSGTGQIAWQVKPCVEYPGQPAVQTVNLAVAVTAERVVVSGAADLQLPCALGGGTAHLTINYNDTFTANASIPVQANGFNGNIVAALQANGQDIQFTLGVQLRFGGPTTAQGQGRGATAQAAPLRILLTDPYGRRVGYDPVSGQVVSEIPGATDNGVVNGVESFTLPAFIGGYQVTLTSAADVATTLSLTFGGDAPVSIPVSVKANTPTALAIGVALGTNGRLAAGAAPAAPGAGPTPSFADVPADYWAHDQIGAFARRGITTGCDTGLYCPDRNVTRAEMAVFLERTLGHPTPPTPTGQTFADVPADYWAYAFIEQFASLGITTGCGADAQGHRLFCPDRNVTRAEMAVFIDRARGFANPVAPAAATFADVPTGYWAFAHVEQFAALGITTGCGTDAQGHRTYCPDRNVTRAEMAVFIIRAYP